MVDRCEANLSANTIFAFIEMLQSYKLNDQVPAVIERLLQREPQNKQVQAMYLDIVGKNDLKKAITLQQSL